MNFTPQQKFLLLSIAGLWLAAPVLALVNLVLVLRRPRDSIHAHGWLFFASLVLGFAWWYAPSLITSNGVTALIYAFGVPNLLLAHSACLVASAWRKHTSSRMTS